MQLHGDFRHAQTIRLSAEWEELYSATVEMTAFLNDPNLRLLR